MCLRYQSIVSTYLQFKKNLNLSQNLNLNQNLSLRTNCTPSPTL